MASSGVVLAHSAFDGLRLGRSAQFIVEHLLRFWDSKNIMKPGEFMGITLLFLDEKNSVIHGFYHILQQFFLCSYFFSVLLALDAHVWLEFKLQTTKLFRLKYVDIKNEENSW